MQLSIIIPYYNAEPYTNELLSALDKQMNPDVEAILVDDGSKTPFKANYKWLSIIRQSNAGVSGARNTGLDHARGDYIAFIDSDDMVSDNYINSILECIKAENPDYIYLSWKTMQGGWQCDVKLKSINDKFPSFNLCVWNRIYKKTMIGSVRFNTRKLIAEDAEFIRLVDENGKKKAFISDYMYFYRSTTPDSLTKRFAKGELLTKRIVYHIPHVKKSMTHLINEFKEADREGEVILLTNNCEIKELSNYAMIMPTSSTIKGTELRGQYTPNFIRIDPPQDYQIIIWTKKTFEIGGIETFIYNFCKTFYQRYDILVLYDEIDLKQLIRLSKFVKVSKKSDSIKYKCETLIINRITDAAPQNITYNKKIQMCHTCKMGQPWTIPTDNDNIVFPSTVAKDSFSNKSGIVIPNPLPEEPTNRALTLVTASRLDTFEKGKSRIIKLCELLKESNIPFIWLMFTKTKLTSCPDGIIQMDARLDIKPYIKTADYLVQLSDAESFCYSIVEALTLGTKVITTPIDVLSEIGFVDKKTGYIIDYDLKDVDINTIYANKDKTFNYIYDNNKVINSWTELLGNNPPKHLYNPQALVQVLVTKDYNDIALATKLKAGTKLCMTRDRAETVKRAGYLKILES